MNDRISYITVVNEHYLPLLDKLLETHQLFCRIQLTVFTINFDYKGSVPANVNFINYVDENISEYDSTGTNRLIKTDGEKYKYTTMLKPRILNKYSHLFEHSFFVDCDGLFTKNSDALFVNTIQEFANTSIPVPVKFYYQYSNHGTDQPIFHEDGTFNIKSLTYLALCELYNTEANIIDYVTTYCLYYTDKCSHFFTEVENICFDPRLASDYGKYLPLGDETAFNYLYAKYNFRRHISSYLCYNILFYQDIDEVLHNLNQISESVSFLHVKRFIGPDYNGELNEADYEKIINQLIHGRKPRSTAEIIDFQREENLDKIIFRSNFEKTDHYFMNVISLSRPNLDIFYSIEINPEYNYFIGMPKDKVHRDLYLIITRDKIIHDCVKV